MEVSKCTFCATIKMSEICVYLWSIVINLILLPYTLAVASLIILRRDCDLRLWLSCEKRDIYKNKVVWVTGATSGIGRELAIGLVKRGAKVVISGRKVPELQETQRLATEHLPADSRDDAVQIVSFPFEGQTSESLNGWSQKAWDCHGRIDVLFNNAGCGSRGVLTSPDTDAVVLESTCNVPIFIMKWLVGKHGLTRTTFKENREVQFMIVNTCSIMSRLPGPARVAYGACKAALMHAADCLRLDLAVLECYGVKIVNCMPGPVATNFSLNCIRDDGEKNKTKEDFLEKGMTSKRCAALMLKAGSRGFKESWISTQPHLDMMYFNYYTPYIVEIASDIMTHIPAVRKNMLVMCGEGPAFEVKDKNN